MFGPRFTNLIVFVVASLVSLIVLEIGLRIATPFPITARSNRVYDGRLLYVLSPTYGDADAAGFRNPGPVQDAEIFAVGDSHTYGYNVAWDQSWPYQLQAQTGRPVYNYGIGSYGLYQYARLFEMAIERKPEFIIVALYPANDLELNACATLGLPYWRERAVRMGLNMRACGDDSDDDVPPGPMLSALRSVLRGEFATLSAIAYLVVNPLKQSAVTAGSFMPGANVETISAEKFIILKQGDFTVSIGRKQVRRHRNSTDLTRDLVQSHFENATIVFRTMQRLAKDAGIGWGVLMVPSKERVMWQWASDNGVAQPDDLDRAGRSEQALSARFATLFAEEGIATVDATADMVQLLAAAAAGGEIVYPAGDGHPTALGYGGYTRAALRLLGSAE